MIFKPDNMEDKTDFTCDVIVIGSGAGGAVAAAKSIELGKSVIIIEEGPYVDSKDFDQNASKLVPLMYNRSAGLSTDDMSIRILQGKVYGGSTTINWMTSLRTPDHVLNQWSDEFGLSEYIPAEMKKHFDEVEERLHVHQIKDEDHNPSNRLILVGAKKLGIHAQASYNNSVDCIGCGTCGLGCPYDKKMDMRMTYLADADKGGANIFTEVIADRIEYLNENSQIIHATILGKRFGLEDRKITIKTGRTVVSGGAIGTPLLLQRSKLTKGGNVGKYFQIHPVTGVYGVYDHEIHPTYGIPQSVLSEEYSNLNGDGYGFWLEAPDLEPFLAGVSGPGFGLARREILKNLTYSAAILVLVRDGANKKSNGEIRYRRGLNTQNGSFSLKKIPSIRYKLCEEDIYSMKKGVENAAQIHFAAGAKILYSLHSKDSKITTPEEIPKLLEMNYGPNHVQKFTAHAMGTARMGKDPNVSVVDETLQMHNYKGIYIMDSSILPTALGVNPMITILATVSRGFELGKLGFNE